MKRNQWIWRWTIYMVGTVFACVGIVLSAKTNLGISPISALPYSVSIKLGVSIAWLLFVVYVIMVALQFLINGKNYYKKDLLQIPVSFLFGLILSQVERFAVQINVTILWQRLLLLLLAILCSGIGSAMMVCVKLVPNPVDGLGRTVGAALSKGLGTGRNIVDSTCVALALVSDLFFHRRLLSIGVGTVLIMIFAGRVIALFNFCFKERILRKCGLTFEGGGT